MVTPDASEQRAVHYSGHVQGVGFRYTVRKIAGSHKVTGYVENLRDGRVHLVVEGSAGEIDRFLAAVRRALDHYIREARTVSGPASGCFERFEIRY